MMPGALILDRFDGQGSVDGHLDGTASEQQALKDAQSPEAMAEAEINPAQTNQGSRPGAKSTALDEQAEQDSEVRALQTELTSILQTVRTDAERAVKAHLAALSDVTHDAMARVLPHLAENGAVREICDVIVRSADSLGPVSMQVSLHPSAHDEVVNCLAAGNTPEPIVVTSDDTIAPGSAKLAWTHGGCDVDIEAALNQAKLLLDAQLDALTTAPRRTA